MGLLDAGQDNEGDDPDRDDQNGSLLINILEDAMGLGDQYPYYQRATAPSRYPPLIPCKSSATRLIIARCWRCALRRC
jgi:hypothetical protein